MNLLLKYQDTLDDGIVGHNCNLCKLEFTEKMAEIYDSLLEIFVLQILFNSAPHVL